MAGLVRNKTVPVVTGDVGRGDNRHLAVAMITDSISVHILRRNAETLAQPSAKTEIVERGSKIRSRDWAPGLAISTPHTQYVDRIRRHQDDPTGIVPHKLRNNVPENGCTLLQIIETGFHPRRLMGAGCDDNHICSATGKEITYYNPGSMREQRSITKIVPLTLTEFAVPIDQDNFRRCAANE